MGLRTTRGVSSGGDKFSINTHEYKQGWYPRWYEELDFTSTALFSAWTKSDTDGHYTVEDYKITQTHDNDTTGGSYITIDYGTPSIGAHGVKGRTQITDVNTKGFMYSLYGLAVDAPPFEWQDDPTILFQYRINESRHHTLNIKVDNTAMPSSIDLYLLLGQNLGSPIVDWYLQMSATQGE